MPSESSPAPQDAKRPRSIWSAQLPGELGGFRLLVIGLGVVSVLLFALFLDFVSPIIAVAGFLGLIRLARTMSMGTALVRLIAVSYVAHLVLMLVVFASLYLMGRQGFVTGDDRAYFDLADRLARHLRGEVVVIGWSGEAYLISNHFVQLQAVLFFVLGSKPLLVPALNVVALHLVALLLAQISLRLFDRRSALLTAALVVAWPSLTLWSVLNLKEALSLLLISLVLWGLHRYGVTGSLKYLLGTFAALVVLSGVREYVFILLALLAPLAVVLGCRTLRDLATRAHHVAGTILASGLLLAISGSGFLGVDLFRVDMFVALEEVRAYLGAGARTAITDAGRGVTSHPGDRFVVVANVSPALCPTGAPRTLVVPDNSRLVLEGTPESRNPASGSVVVCPNDIVVVAGGPVSTSPPQQVVVGAERQPAPELRTDEMRETDAVVRRTLGYLPTGFAYALFAPFPWRVERPADLLAVGETVLWSVVLVAAVSTTWRERRRWRNILPLTLYALGLITIFALFEGNVGTIFRHRAMLMPAVLLLAAPTLLRWLGVLASRRT